MAAAPIPARKRQQNEAKGRRAEHLCSWILRLGGWKILAHRYRQKRGSTAGEVDIIARRGNTLAFIEVKARDDETAALESLTPRQRRRIEAGAQAFLAQNPELNSLDMRFDLMIARPLKPPRHLADAWRYGD